jgi:hypothetical protein
MASHKPSLIGYFTPTTVFKLCVLSQIDSDKYHVSLSHFSLDFNHYWGYKPNNWCNIPIGYWVADLVFDQ